MANPQPSSETPMNERPEEAVERVLELTKRLNNRIEVMRRLKEDDAKDKARFDLWAQRDWDALDVLRASYEAQRPADRDIGKLDEVIDKRAAIADMKRATHDAVLGMVRGIVPVAARTTGHSEEWLSRALEFITFSTQREAQHAIDVHFALEVLASEVDPENELSGDVLETGDDVSVWFKRMSAAQ